jgi:hypothetical protein
MLKFYTYVSKAKVDMLLPQVPRVFKNKFSAELGINIGIFTTKISSESSGRVDDSDVHRLELVSDYLKSSDEVGDLKSSKKWIKDDLEVKHLTVKENRNLFLLVGKKHDAYHLLGGSTHHIIGNVKAAEVSVNYSYFPQLVEELSDALSEKGQAREEAVQQHLAEQGIFEKDLLSMEQEEWAEVVCSLYERSTSPTFSVRFLARFLSRAETYDDQVCTVSSPLYVQQL